MFLEKPLVTAVAVTISAFVIAGCGCRVAPDVGLHYVGGPNATGTIQTQGSSAIDVSDKTACPQNTMLGDVDDNPDADGGMASTYPLALEIDCMDSSVGPLRFAVADVRRMNSGDSTPITFYRAVDQTPGCSSPLTATLTIVNATGGYADSPSGVTSDYRRDFRITYDSSQDTSHACDSSMAPITLTLDESLTANEYVQSTHDESGFCD